MTAAVGSPGMGRRNPFASLIAAFEPLRIASLRVYLSGQAVSLVGVFMQVTAQSWLVWELSRSGAALGLTVSLGFVPILFLGPWTGTIADRLDRRRVLIGTQLAAMLLAFTLAALVQTGLIRLWHIYVLASALGVVTALDFPAQQAFIGDLSGVGQVRQAIVLNGMIVQVSRMLGPAVAGWLLAVSGAAIVFWINGATFLAVIATLLIVRATQVRQRAATSSLGAFRESLRFLRGQSRLQDLVIVTVLVTFFALASIFFLPAVTTEILGGREELLGMLFSASGAGALVGTVVATPLVQTARRTGLVLTGCVLWTGTWLVALAFSRWVPVSLVAVFALSLTVPVVITTANGLMQALAPPDMRARLLSLLIMVTFGAQPIASLLTGLVSDLSSPTVALALNGIALAIGSAVLFVARPELRTWRMGPPPTPRERGGP